VLDIAKGRLNHYYYCAGAICCRHRWNTTPSHKILIIRRPIITKKRAFGAFFAFLISINLHREIQLVFP